MGHMATASVTIDVRAFTVDVAQFLGASYDSRTGVISMGAWTAFLRATLTALDPSYVISFPSLPPGAAAAYSGTPVGNVAEFKWRAIGVQAGTNLIPVHVVAGVQMYDGNLVVDVTQDLSGPTWWRDPATRILDPNAVDRRDFAIANQGQVKHIARMAALAIQAAKQSNSSIFITNNQVQGLLDFTNDPTKGFTTTNNYVACNHGQLKFIAKQFYSIFTNVAMPDAGVLFPTNGQTTFPWSPQTSDDVNYAPVNIGQVKAFFGFDPSYFYQ